MIWTAVLRPYAGEVILSEVLTLTELSKKAVLAELRLRYNPSMRLLILRLPDGTRRKQVFAAFDLLTRDERRRLYHLRQHPLMETRRVE